MLFVVHMHLGALLLCARDERRGWLWAVLCRRDLPGQSDIGLVVMTALLALAAYHFGVWKVACVYFVPYLVVNAYLIIITYLHHTAVYVPHYRAAEFTWLRGALSTVDRSFGWVLDHVLHHITDTHVCHHLFHTIPFYHAQVRA